MTNGETMFCQTKNCVFHIFEPKAVTEKKIKLKNQQQAEDEDLSTTLQQFFKENQYTP